MVYPNNKKDVDKAVKLDKKEYSREGFLTVGGYVPYRVCMDICKLAKQGKPPMSMTTEFDLYSNDIMNIIALYAKYITADVDIYSVSVYGGQEYSEQKKRTGDKPLGVDDLNDILMDIAIFEKGKTNE